MNVDTLIITVSGIISVILGFWLHSYFTIRFNRRQESFRVAMNYVCEDKLQKYLILIASEKNIVKKITTYFNKNKKLAEHANYVLNYFETLSFAMVNKDIDEKIMKKTFRHTFLNLYFKFKPYNNYLIKKHKTFKGFEHFIKIAKKWQAEESKE